MRPARVLSAIVAALMAAGAATGLLWDGLYRDNALVTAGWRGNDFVTLVIAVPVLVTALMVAARGSDRAWLVWLGVLAYALYNSAFYVFGAAFNPLFLLNVAVFALSGASIITLLTSVEPRLVEHRVAPRAARWIGVWLMLIAVALGALWLTDSLRAAISGQPPSMTVVTGHPTNVVAALDLTFIVPVAALGALWLWRRRRWAYVVATACSIQSVVYMLVLAAATVSAARAGAVADARQAWIWIGIAVGSAITMSYLLSHPPGPLSAAPRTGTG